MKKLDLLQALETVKPGLANKEVIDQATSFAFLKNKVITYNDEISISCPVSGLDWNGIINSKELYDYLLKVKEEEIIIEKIENEIILTAGKAKAGLTLQTEIKLPLGNIMKEKKWVPLPENFLKAISMVVEITKHDDSNPIVNSIHICEKDYIEATDNYRFLRYHVNVAKLASTLISAESAKEILKFNPEMISREGNWLFFRTIKNAELACRIIDIKFPNGDSILNTEEGQTFIFPKQVLSIIDKAQVFAKQDVLQDERVKITVINNQITFESRSNTGWFKETTKVRGKNELTFTIVPVLLKDILKETRKCIVSKNRLLKFEGVNWEYVTMLSEDMK